ncbi:MAG: OmpH family outer membrane protein [Pseudomonadota bacterium]|jgi:outer membrane protein|nr:OmpH family outer membrane protein [Pseudomonadota bacterium]
MLKRFAPLAALWCLASPVFAELKIAVLDVQRAVLQSQEAQAFVQQVQEQLGPDETKVRKLQADAQKLQERMQKDGAIMSETERRELAEQLEEMAVNYKYLLGKLQTAQKEKQQQLLTQMNPKLEQAVREVLSEERYDLVLQRQALVFAADSIDITEKVTARLDQLAD